VPDPREIAFLTNRAAARLDHAVRFDRDFSREGVNVTPVPGLLAAVRPGSVVMDVTVTGAFDGDTGLYPGKVLLGDPDPDPAAGVPPPAEWRDYPEEAFVWVMPYPGQPLQVGGGGPGRLVGVRTVPGDPDAETRLVYAMAAAGAARSPFPVRLTENTAAASAVGRQLDIAFAWADGATTYTNTLFPTEVETAPGSDTATVYPYSPTARGVVWADPAQADKFNFTGKQYAGLFAGTYYPGELSTGAQEVDGPKTWHREAVFENFASVGGLGFDTAGDVTDQRRVFTVWYEDAYEFEGEDNPQTKIAVCVPHGGGTEDPGTTVTDEVGDIPLKANNVYVFPRRVLNGYGMPLDTDYYSVNVGGPVFGTRFKAADDHDYGGYGDCEIRPMRYPSAGSGAVGGVGPGNTVATGYVEFTHGGLSLGGTYTSYSGGSPGYASLLAKMVAFAKYSGPTYLTDFLCLSIGGTACYAAAGYGVWHGTSPTDGISFGQDATTGGLTFKSGIYVGGTTGSGTVTSVGLTGPVAGITVSGSPVTSSGTFTLALADDLAALEALTGTDTIYYRSGASTWSAVTVGTGLSFSGGTLSATGGTGTVTSVQVSGASTGLTFTGGPITGAGTITLGGILGVAYGGTGYGLTTSGPGVVYQTSYGGNLAVMTPNTDPGDVTDTAGGTYGGTEQTMLTNLKDRVNTILAILRLLSAII